MTAIRVEEGNLVDLLRRCLRFPDADAVVALMACLSDFWTIEGSHLKVVNIAPEDRGRRGGRDGLSELEGTRSARRSWRSRSTR